uniref:Serine protease inhibitor-like protein n=2 Tax=Trichostrongylus vitrinus TaxID=40352 RepID=Q9NLA5_TRIVI|nr:serine protease inhibitor-like protein [Trichostrongylus vitrinus]
MFLTAETDFGLNMLKHAPANESLVVSPLSVIFALAMVQAGAKGTTKSQISAVLSKGSSDSEITEHYSNLSSQIMNARNGVRSRIANGFFLNKQFAIEKGYEKSIRESYNAKVEALDFDKANEAAKVIDDFISKTTEGKIKDMVTAGMVKDAYSLIVNAIYFTAEWVEKFYKSSNSNETFYSTAEKGRKMEFMNDFEEDRLYAEDDDFQVLSLRYLDTSFAFNIFLPKTRFGLNALRSKLDGEQIQRLLSTLKETYISITIPKMKIETDFKLKEALVAMGVSEMFTDKANLSGIIKEPPLKISSARHRAAIEVDEEGTTAAAARCGKWYHCRLCWQNRRNSERIIPFSSFLPKITILCSWANLCKCLLWYNK